MKLRIVQLAIENGLTLFGLVPATVSDAELESTVDAHIEVSFSAAYEVDGQTPIKVLLQRVIAASLGRTFH